MKCASCLRLASRSRALNSLSSPFAGSHSIHAEGKHPRTSSGTSTRPAYKHRLSTPSSGTRCYSRFQDETAGSPSAGISKGTTSSFNKQRQQQLKIDEEDNGQALEATHPRIPNMPTRISVPEFLEAFHGRIPTEEVTLSGRIRSKRVVGKNLVFLDIVNEFQKAQIMVNKKKVEAPLPGRPRRFDLLRNLIQVGDHISVTGLPMLTPSGERTLEAKEMPRLLSPTMEQIPEKLTDEKSRRQQRHVDMLVNQEVLDVIRLRSEIVQYMREHLNSKRFLECQTPILAENAGGASARPFVTRATEFRDKDLALRIAPELWLKRLVIGGIDRVYEIGPAFRNEGIDQTHNPEFTTCEFYSAYSNLADLINETEEILCGMAKRCQEKIATEFAALPPIDMSRFVRPFKQVEFVPALEAAMGIRLPKLTAEDALPEVTAVLKLAGIQVPGETPTTLPKLLDRLAAIYLEPASFDRPIFITHHPACMSPLAKSFLCPTTYQLVSARAELFIGGRELANMYEEENDPAEQKRKLAAHRSLVNKPDGSVGTSSPQSETTTPETEEMPDPDAATARLIDGDGDAPPLDESYIRALDYGLPPTGGWGCGVERLVMLFSGANRIGDCLSFGTLRNVVGLSSEDKESHR